MLEEHLNRKSLKSMKKFWNNQTLSSDSDLKHSFLLIFSFFFSSLLFSIFENTLNLHPTSFPLDQFSIVFW